MWLTMTGMMMAPVVFPWLRALSRLADGGAVAAVGPFSSVGPFAAGYAVAWAGFSAALAGVHLALSRMSVPVPFGLEAPALSAAALFLAGGFQFTRLKEACLSHCRSPAGYLLTHWRSGAAGHTRLGRVAMKVARSMVGMTACRIRAARMRECRRAPQRHENAGGHRRC